ncbi:MAG: DUF4235 domain-containing protein [Solirubrobacterales bacterium]|nr:DUF4235 domain-containing protein [Solirubrobacterales bacterium]MBV9715275.1 DUF4235 domain-containing protein [Solirubrobacterales bacterium]
MKILYKPFAIVFALIAARIGKSVFKALWSAIDDADPPKASAPHASFGKVVAAAALEAVTMASVGAAADRASAQVFYHLTGAWPGSDEDTR